MKTEKTEAEQAQETDEYTLESWQAERQKLETEMAADSAQLKAAMEEALANDDLPSEMKKIIRESGSKLLEADEWLREMYDSTEDTIKRCDELIAKVDALEARRRQGGEERKARREMTTEAKTMHAVEDEGGYATTEEIRKNLFGFIPAVTRAIGWPARSAQNGEDAHGDV